MQQLNFQTPSSMLIIPLIPDGDNPSEECPTWRGSLIFRFTGDGEPRQRLQMIVGRTIQQGPPNVHSADKGPEGCIPLTRLCIAGAKLKNMFAGLSS